MNSTAYHIPVLLQASLQGLQIKPDGVYVDATFGGGGHSAHILQTLNQAGKLFAFDQDEDAAANVPEDGRLTFVPQNFGFVKNFLRMYGITQIDGLLADLGVSSHQFNVAERGFSTRFDAVLDMRMDKNNSVSAQTVLNDYDEKKLSQIFKYYGELHQARGMAAAIIAYREKQKITTSEDLKNAVRKFILPHRENKMMAQLFQAIRIEVNQELEALKKLLSQAAELIKPGGRLCVISYHSLEDRLVKRFIRNGLFEGEPERDLYGNFYVPFKAVGKFIVPDENEIDVNPRARSAKLRIAEKTSL